MKKLISAVQVEELKEPKDSKEEEALTEMSGKHLLRERFRSLEALFGEELVNVFGKKILESRGALAIIKADIKGTLGNTLLADRDPLTIKNLIGYHRIFAEYERLKDKLTRINETDHPIVINVSGGTK